LFHAARGAAAESSSLAVMPARRSALGNRILRHLSWAAAVAVVLAALGGVWLQNERGRADSAAAKQPAMQPATRPPAAESDALPSAAAEAERQGEAIAAAGVESGAIDQPGQAPARASKRVTSARMTSPAVPASVQISAIDFESGSLGQWQ